MPAEKAAAADAYWRFTAEVEPVITRQMQVTVADIGGRLVGLEHRLKQMDSLKRKLVTREQKTGESLTTLLFSSDDAMRYTIVIDDASYVRGVAEAVAALERSGLHTADISNAWHSGRYRGINTSWMDPRSGAAFEVQFHTPKSWEITKLTHPWYEEMRLPSTPPERRRELEARIAAEYEGAERPDDVAGLNRGSLPPATPPAPIEVPTDLTAPAAAFGAGAGVPVAGGQDKMAASDGGGRVDDGGGGDMDHRGDPVTERPVLAQRGTGQPP